MFILLSIYHACDRAIIIRMIEELHALQRPPPVRSTRRGLSGIECRPVQRPGLCALPCVVCPGSGTACAAACDVQAVRVRWEVQGATGGVYGESREWGGRHLA
nr:MAG TPA: hypothetical protein [Caudoviricetes sp.]